MKGSYLVWIRRISQGFFLFLFLFLLIESRLPQNAYLNYSLIYGSEPDLRLKYPVTFFFKLDPLIHVTSLLSAHRLINGTLWAVGLILLTLILGRVFCGFICPLGTINHLMGSIRSKEKGHFIRVNQKSRLQKIKYGILIGILVGAISGINLTGWFDPMALLFRSLSTAIFPAIGIAIKDIMDLMAGSDLHFLRLLSYTGEIIISPVFGYGYPAYQTGWFIGILFIFILFMNRLIPRFWCRVICPLGALLGLCSRLRLLHLEKESSKCSDCGKCRILCQGAASPSALENWDSPECMLCFNCEKVCPEDALSFRFALKRKKYPEPGPDMGRRTVLSGLLWGLSVPLLGRAESGFQGVPDPRLIRPPGAVSERKFLSLCQRCGLCMKVCPTNVINPAFSEAGLSGIWTPVLIMRNGYCEYTCTLCGSVCPTGALRNITSKEKIETPIRIGSAYIDRGRCLPWSGNTPCIVCEEHCPTSPKAIYLKKVSIRDRDGKRRDFQLPYVDLKRCIGCGICEFKCPVKGRPAIRVIGAGESRNRRNQILL